MPSSFRRRDSLSSLLRPLLCSERIAWNFFTPLSLSRFTTSFYTNQITAAWLNVIPPLDTRGR